MTGLRHLAKMINIVGDSDDNFKIRNAESCAHLGNAFMASLVREYRRNKPREVENENEEILRGNVADPSHETIETGENQNLNQSMFFS